MFYFDSRMWLDIDFDIVIFYGKLYIFHIVLFPIYNKCELRGVANGVQTYS